MTNRERTVSELHYIGKVRRLFDEISDALGERFARELFAEIGKPPRGRPKGARTKNLAPANTPEAMRKRRYRDPFKLLRRPMSDFG